MSSAVILGPDGAPSDLGLDGDSQGPHRPDPGTGRPSVTMIDNGYGAGHASAQIAAPG